MQEMRKTHSIIKSIVVKMSENRIDELAKVVQHLEDKVESRITLDVSPLFHLFL